MKKDELHTWVQSFKMLSAIIIPSMAASFVPDPVFGAGVSNFFLQAFFQVQGDIKLQRVDSLLKGFERMLQTYNPNIKLDASNPHELRDHFETAIINAAKANSESKIDRLRRVLFGQIVDPQPYDYTSRYLDLAVRLNDDQIRILLVFTETEYELEPIRQELFKTEKLHSDILAMESKISGPNSKASKKQVELLLSGKQKSLKKMEQQKKLYNTITNKRYRFNATFEKEHFRFLFNDIRALGLVYNAGEGTFSSTGEPANFQCTSLALGFMKFLQYPLKA